MYEVARGTFYQTHQPDFTAIRTYFTRWLINTNSYFAKSYVFYELPIRMNLYEWPTPNPAPKPTRHEFVRIRTN